MLVPQRQPALASALRGAAYQSVEYLAGESKLVTNDFDTDKLVVHKVRARERMSVSYQVEVDVIAPNGDAPPIEELAGATVTVVLSRGGEVLRRYGGLVMSAKERHARDEGHLGFALTLVPTIWLATLVETLDIVGGFIDMGAVIAGSAGLGIR